MMKKILFVLALISALIFSAKAAEGDYIIKYRSDVPMFYSEEDSASSLGAGMFLVSKEKALALKDAGMLEICAPDDVMTYYDVPANDTYYTSQYNIPMIKAPYAWHLNTFGDDVLVAVIDSGLAVNHPDIDYSRVVEGYNFGADSSDSDYATNQFDTTDVNGHGTMVAGIIAAKRNNSLYLAGIADKVKLLPIKVENKQGIIYIGSVISAINFAWDYHGCDVINLSLGQPSSHPGLEEAVKNAINSGCIVVCAVGNDTKNDPGDHLRYPAAYPGVIGVASIDSKYAHVESSVTNESVFISAPAAGIPVLHRLGGYTFAGGTSLASPQVAAAAAIAKQIYPQLTPAQFAQALASTSKDLNLTVDGRDNEFGYGLLNMAELTRYVFSLKNKKIYVSAFEQPANSITICNLTDSDFKAASIFTSYMNSRMNYYDGIPLTLKPGEIYRHKLSTTKEHTRIGHFLWNSTKSASPVEWYIPQILNKQTSSK